MAITDDPGAPQNAAGRPAKWVSYAFAATIAVYTGLYAVDAWRAIEGRAVKRLSQLSEYTSVNVDHSVDQISLGMRLLAAQIREKGDLNHPRKAQVLFERMQHFWPQLSGVELIHPAGLAPAASRRLSDTHVHLGHPTENPRTRHWFIPIVQVFPNPSAQAEIVVHARMMLSFEHNEWRVLRLRPGVHIGLMREDGYLEDIWPRGPEFLIARLFLAPHPGVLAASLRAHPALMHHDFIGVTAPLHMHLAGSFTRLPHYPEVVAFAVERVALIRAHWLRDMRLPFLLALLLIVGAVIVHYWSEYQFRQWERERENALAREMRQRDFYAALSDINQLIAHHPDPHHLFTRVCDIVVTHTYLRLAWIATVGPDGTASIVASSGPAHAYARKIRVSVDPGQPEGRGPFGRAFRAGQTMVLQDLATEQGFEPWREIASTYGLVASASFPFKNHGEVAGVLTVYAGQSNFFEPELVQLLEELALDITFSLEDFDRQQELLRLALHDTLTGLANRQLFMDRLGQGLAVARREDRLVAIGVVDLDDFKQINDRLGHAAGDDALQQIARRLHRWIRETDTLARLGGDEFGFVLGSTYNMQEITTVLQRMIAAVAAPMVLENGENIAITASIGAAVYPFDDADLNALLRHADLALYRAKDAGGNGYAFFEQPFEDRMLERHRSRAEIQDAFRRREFVAHYQPQVDLATGRVLGVEALVRWRHPERGLLMPVAFIKVIEDDAEFIRSLGRFMLEEVARQVQAWRADGLDLVASVNIGARHLLAPEFMHDIEAVLDRFPDIARHLTLEVTETDALKDLTQTGQVLSECRRLGFSISVDDFGSGYASLTYLQKLPIDQIKIDQGFVRGLLDDPKNIAIVAGLIGAVKLLKIEMIAEGVESIEHGNLLLKLGSPLAQGYAIAKAMEPEALLPWARTWKPNEVWVRMAQHPYASEDYGLLMLLLQHDKQMRTLVDSLSRVLSDPAALPPQPEDFKCVIDDWYESEGRPRYGHLPVFTEIRESYHRLCDEVQELLKDVLAGAPVAERVERLRALDARLRNEFDRLLLTY
ncbi:MAG: putative bifunctional diguanylate cyclase/phosphodiesterase [Acidiferrobacteraceae bacterium]